MLNIKYDILSLNTESNITIIKIENIPPVKLNIPATNPLVISTNDAFNITMVKADDFPIKNKQYITTIFARPNLIPGTGIGIVGKKFSSIDKINAKAKSIDVRTSFFVLLIFIAFDS